MTTLPVNTESVIERIQAMRISAEGALGSVQASLA